MTHIVCGNRQEQEYIADQRRIVAGCDMTKTLHGVHTCTSQSELRDVNMSYEPFFLAGNEDILMNIVAMIYITSVQFWS